jgi:processing peptidase subunit alpha
MCAKIEAVTMSELRRVAKLVFGGAVKNIGGGSGIPTVVLQEGEGGTGFKGGWEEIQERIQRWGLGVRR